MLVAPPIVGEPPTQPDGHRRMVRELAAIADAVRRDNPFLGEGAVPELQAQLDAVEDPDDPRVWFLGMQLGRELLKLGRSEESIAAYQRAYDQVVRFREETPPEEALRTTYELALAWMRQGENLNCAQNHTSESCLLPIRGGGVHKDKAASRAAVELFAEVLRLAKPESPESYRARWLLNIAYMTLGEYPDGVPAPWRIPESAFASDQPFPLFPEVAPLVGLDSFDLAGGAVVDDFNGDDQLDVVVTTSDPSGPMRIWLGSGTGQFTEHTAESGLAGITGGLNMIHGDYDGDGDLDLFVLRGAWWKALGRHPNSLLRNHGDGRFTDVTYEAGLGHVHFPTHSAAFADYDNDGDLDLYVGNEYSPEMPAPSQLFRNDGDGTFTDVAARAGVENRGYAKGVTWGDYDNDRFPDLFVSNHGGVNRLYRNNADGTFTDVAGRAGVSRPVAGFPTWFWDIDNDGILDLFVGTYGGVNPSPDVAAVAASYLGRPHTAELDHIYRGDGEGGFVEVGESFGMRRATLPMGANFGDLDNDGFPDFYLGTGYPHYEGLVPNVMYRNTGGDGFADVTTAGRFGHLQKGHAVVFADLDNDGDQDVFEQIGGQYRGDAFGNALFDNPGFGNRWIKIRLVGARSNRFGVGAQIRLDIVEGERRRSIHRTVGTGGSFGGNPLRQEIGLGRADTIETLEIFWPTSGRRQTFRDVAPDQWLVIGENDTTLVGSGAAP